MIEEAIIWLGFLGIFFLILTVGGMIADYALPRIPFIGRFFDSLPEREDDAEIARRYERIQRQKATRRRKQIHAAMSSLLRPGISTRQQFLPENARKENRGESWR